MFEIQPFLGQVIVTSVVSLEKGITHPAQEIQVAEPPEVMIDVSDVVVVEVDMEIGFKSLPDVIAV